MNPLNSCGTSTATLLRYVHERGMMPAKERTAVETHLQNCAACRAAHGKMTALDGLLTGHFAAPPAPPWFGMPARILVASLIGTLLVVGGGLLATQRGAHSSAPAPGSYCGHTAPEAMGRSLPASYLPSYPGAPNCFPSSARAAVHPARENN